MSTPTHRQRLETCLSGQIPDRTPVALWRHFPVDDQTPAGLAAATLNFQHNFDFDLVKVTPSSSFCLRDWGIGDEWRGADEGTRDYTRRVIHEPEDWTRLRVLPPTQGALGDQLECLRYIVAELGPETPVIQTIFSPLSQAKNLVGPEKLFEHLRQSPEALHAGLKTITESVIRFTEAALEIGIAGVFYAVQHAQYGLLSEAEYQIFGKVYDLQCLEPAQTGWLNMLHLHGQAVMFDQVSDLPIQILNWHDRETPPSLAQAKDRFHGVLCGGLQRIESMVLGTPEAVTAEAREAIAATEGRRFILGTGCVSPITTPYGNLMAARKAVEF
ncbi:MAG TPA: uroporphyrinogen decarboxylase [Chloroflexi bacterium]|nr:uroporphyrinogen decarboxylase [Chloroflexota bacterium]